MDALGLDTNESHRLSPTAITHAGSLFGPVSGLLQSGGGGGGVHAGSFGLIQVGLHSGEVDPFRQMKAILRNAVPSGVAAFTIAGTVITGAVVPARRGRE